MSGDELIILTGFKIHFKSDLKISVVAHPACRSIKVK